MSNAQSYVHGASRNSLIGSTIGRYLTTPAPAMPDARRWWCATRTSA